MSKTFSFRNSQLNNEVRIKNHKVARRNTTNSALRRAAMTNDYSQFDSGM